MWPKQLILRPRLPGSCSLGEPELWRAPGRSPSACPLHYTILAIASIIIIFFQSKGTLWDSSCDLTLIRDPLKSERRGQTTLPDHRYREKTSDSRWSRFPEPGWRRDCLGTGSPAALHPPTVPAAALSRLGSKSQKRLWAAGLPLAPGSPPRAGPRICPELRCTSVLTAHGKANGTRVGKGKKNRSYLVETPIAFFPTGKRDKLPVFARTGEFRDATIVVLTSILKLKTVDAL